ncbi:mevalonate kinase family protein [Phaeocystidibacter luteus]|uniref:Mevalonate kinase n=1 Tax=Phaeocystidibacter luteus TaxID=911197 RepID=A0A6N6RKR7_9FLAO|nr:mevalonate kinase [Phaeocystidibacter luteus]KAB2813780.1 mevalonate kinase [Phaeocystidibacter luteus]
MSKGPLFYAKILLFGEYGIIKDAMGLSIPYNYYKGAFQLPEEQDERTRKSNESLAKFHNHLLSLQQEGKLKAKLDLAAFKSDIDAGWFFDSSIPQGFGVGSSGALVAAIYDRYAIDKVDPQTDINRESLIALKAQFAQMESFFHGKSSGIDPTICYLNLPLLIQGKDDLGTVDIPAEKAGQGAIFLINSGQPGETQPMVNIFMDKLKEEGFRKLMKEQFKKYNDACIQAFLKGDMSPLFSNLKHLSHLLLENFSPMIPAKFHDLWKQGIDSNAYYLKLCGSGGGGYLLGFTRDYEEALPLLEEHNPEVIYRF